MITRLSILIGAIAFLNVAVLQAQFSFSGSVKDGSGLPLPGIALQIQNSYKLSFTNENGEFLFENLKTGKYFISISSLGFENLLDTLEIGSANVEKNYQLKAKSYLTEEVLISSTKAGANTPTTFSNLSKEELGKQNFGQDLPFLLDGTPSTVVSSDAGAGVGYTGIRIRGVDNTRTNVTVNGIPINDAESHGTYWVNMPDFVSSANSIQVQRGVGTSTNGAAAFGASVNIQTNEYNDKAYGEVANSYGSFNTWKHTVKAGTGLINQKFTIDARLSQITSDGYIDRASANLKSYYLAGAYYGKNTTIRANIFAGKEVTYQAWYGTPESVVKGDSAGVEAYIARNWIGEKEAERLKNSGRTYNYYTYDNEVDNYQQDHYQLHLSHQFNSKWNGNLSFHYTRGAGYYEQYREDDDLSVYGISPLIFSTDTVTTSDIIRRRWLDNHFYGTVYSLNYKNLKGFEFTFGGAANTYEGLHFGEIIWAKFAGDSKIRDQYYHNYANKTEANNYVKFNYQKKQTYYFVDLQHRYIHYQFQGLSAQNDLVFPVTRKVFYHFFNPKAGISHWVNSQNKLYLSYSIANREPVRSDFTESSLGEPKPEQLHNVELGHQLLAKTYYLKSNLYYMYYVNQLVLTGQLNDVGNGLRVNVKESYRTGLELDGGILVLPNFKVSGNFTYSKNIIPEFTEYIDDYDNGGQITVHHTNTNIAFSPEIIAGANVTWLPVKQVELSLLPKYVGKQYLDNTKNESRVIDPFTVINFRAQYTVKDLLFKEVSFGLLVNNIFSELYENNGYTYSYFYGGETITENFYYPQAGRNFLVNLVVKF